MPTHLNPDWIRDPQSYPQYRSRVSALLELGKTTGKDSSETLVAYTRLNETRMNRLDHQIRLDPPLEAALRQIQAPQRWVVLAEAWCGDCAQNLPVLARVAAASEGRVQLQIVDRDACPELMDAFLTRGTRSIPKLIVAERDSLEVLGTWGPRPQAVQACMNDWKQHPGSMSLEELEKRMHLWYARDLGRTLQAELLEELQASSVPAVQ